MAPLLTAWLRRNAYSLSCAKLRIIFCLVKLLLANYSYFASQSFIFLSTLFSMLVPSISNSLHQMLGETSNEAPFI